MASGNVLAVFTPGSYEPPASAYAAYAVRNQHPVLAFDTATQETAVWTGFMPPNYGGGNIIVKAIWAADTATTGTIGWDSTIERIDEAGLDVDADSFATAQTITAATVPAAAGVTKATSVTHTAGATGTDSLAASELFRLRIRRDVANDTATGDAHLLGVVLTEA
jgi:hypothetical protein